MNNNRFTVTVKMMKWSLFFLGVIFSASAFSTAMVDINVAGHDATYSTQHGIDEHFNRPVWSINAEESYSVDFSYDAANGNTESIAFLYGLWSNPSLDVEFDVFLNGNKLGSLTATAGYETPGYQFGLFDSIDSSYFNSGDIQALTFTVLTPDIHTGTSANIIHAQNLLALGRIEMDYTPNGQGTTPGHPPTVQVPAPAVLSLMVAGLLGMSFARKAKS